MKHLLATLLMLTALAVRAEDAPALTPVADPRPILAELQQKMSSLTSVYHRTAQERRRDDD